MIWTGVYCEKAICPGPMITTLQGTNINECSGKGACGVSADAQSALCACVNSETGGSYQDLDCATPPSYFVTEVGPVVGPTDGGTNIVIRGPGLDRIFSRNHYIKDWQNARKLAFDSENLKSLFCEFNMTSDDGSKVWTLPLTPALWHANVMKRYVPTNAAANHLNLDVGDKVIVYGCNPCDRVGTSKNARLVVEMVQKANEYHKPITFTHPMNGEIGFVPADLYYFDSETDWGQIQCVSPPSDTAGKPCLV